MGANNFPGDLVSYSYDPAVERQEIHVDTEEIEELLRSKFEKDGWKVEFDWHIGQWATLAVKRTKKAK